MISPVRPRGLGGGGCLLGSVGLSETDVFKGLRAGGGVMGLGMRLADGGVGEGGRGRARGFGGKGEVFAWFLVRERGTENERDLNIEIINSNDEQLVSHVTRKLLNRRHLLGKIVNGITVNNAQTQKCMLYIDTLLLL